MSRSHKTMSLEAALEEERIEVEALIAATSRPRPPSALSGTRSSSPYTARSPVRSMLDIGEYHPTHIVSRCVYSSIANGRPPSSRSNKKHVEH